MIPQRSVGPSSPRPPAPLGDQGATGASAYVGLALLGWGLSILLGVTPHEDLLVGAGLTLFGAALVVTAGRLPRALAFPPRVLAAAGLGAAGLVMVYDWLADARLDAPKLAIIALGLGSAAAAPFLNRRVLPDRPDRSSITVASLVAVVLVVLGTPLAVWAAQAAFKSSLGSTPIEAFVHVALLIPVGLFLAAIGLHPALQGQTITYGTPRGELSVEIGAACSGVQAMALFAGVLALYLFAERPSGRRLALWCTIGLVGVYVANLLRLVMLVLVGYQWGAEALVQAHAQAGWLFFVAWAVAFAALARTRRKPTAQS